MADSEFPDPPTPPVGEEESDRRFFVDMREGAVPVDAAGPSNFTEIVPLDEEPITAAPPDDRWDPSSGEAMGFPLMKACIMDDINGETEFTTQIGRIYWRLDDDLGSGSGGSGAQACDPCKGETIGDNCFVPLDPPHTH